MTSIADTRSAGPITVRAVRTGDVQIKRRQVEPRYERRETRVLDVLGDRTWTPQLPISCYVIDHPEGVIVVDAGGDARHREHTPAWHVIARTCDRQRQAAGEEVGPQLRRLGYDPQAVSKLVLTHMHGDHVGGLAHFEGVEILVSAQEAALALGRLGPANAYFARFYPSWFNPTRLTFSGSPWETFDASIALTEDGRVRALPTPGHTDGHLSVAVELPDHIVFLAGDATYVERALLEGRIDGVAQNAKAHRDSTARVRALCTQRPVILVPTHDPEGSARLERGQVTTVDRR